MLTPGGRPSTLPGKPSGLASRPAGCGRWASGSPFGLIRLTVPGQRRFGLADGRRAGFRRGFRVRFVAGRVGFGGVAVALEVGAFFDHVAVGAEGPRAPVALEVGDELPKTASWFCCWSWDLICASASPSGWTFSGFSFSTSKTTKPLVAYLTGPSTCLGGALKSASPTSPAYCSSVMPGCRPPLASADSEYFLATFFQLSGELSLSRAAFAAAASFAVLAIRIRTSRGSGRRELGRLRGVVVVLDFGLARFAGAFCRSVPGFCR